MICVIFQYLDPTEDPTSNPSEVPTVDPTNDPTQDPLEETDEPSVDPTSDPTNDPTSDPVEETDDPTVDPTVDPTDGMLSCLISFIALQNILCRSDGDALIAAIGVSNIGSFRISDRRSDGVSNRISN